MFVKPPFVTVVAAFQSHKLHLRNDSLRFGEMVGFWYKMPLVCDANTMTKANNKNNDNKWNVNRGIFDNPC